MRIVREQSRDNKRATDSVEAASNRALELWRRAGGIKGEPYPVARAAFSVLRLKTPIATRLA